MVSTLQPVVLLTSQKLERARGEKVLDTRGKSCMLRASRQGMGNGVGVGVWVRGWGRRGNTATLQ